VLASSGAVLNAASLWLSTAGLAAVCVRGYVPETRGFELPTKAKSTPAPLSEDAIRDRAYLMWEADGRPEGMADHYWMKAAAPDVSAKPKAKATAVKTAAALKSAKPKGKPVNPAEVAPPKAKAASKAEAKPKLKAAAAKVSAPAVKVKPAAKAPIKSPARKAAKKA